ncbi:hypothetical protein GBAR_LOCUS14480 [Geodia barretti]|uniref:Calx-beta domain-containing protein n=1 Tax=Geodia barretti TaxID=519541 RepID=A0AA35SAM4_GEOBA|nr:hypothetical protein GBAR_LOCUS14480 [Geodia barretti]
MAIAAGRVLLALYSLFYLLGGVLCQEERPLRCFQTSTDCGDGDEAELPYSECCAIASAAFMINDTCYECSGLLSFIAQTYEVGEGDKYVSVGVRRVVNPGTNTFFFSAVINDGTAKAGIDYGQFPDSGVGFIHVILMDESQVDAGIVILDDNIVEYNENFTVSLQPLSNTFEPLGDPQDTVEVTITDDDKVDISLSPRGPLVVNESSSLVFLLNKTGLADRAVRVTVDLSDQELEFGDGAPPSIRTFTFEPNDPPKQIDVVVRDDDVVEATEDHLIFLRVPEGETGVNLPRDSETLRVQDDGDSVQLSLPPPGNATLTVEESQGEVRIPLDKLDATRGQY